MRILAMCFMLLFLPALASGCVKTGTAGNEAAFSKAAGDGKSLPARVSFLLQDNSSWRFRKDADIFKLISQKVNVSLDFIIIPEANYQEKKDMLIASGELPDIIFIQGSQDEIAKYAGQGVLLPLDDLIEKEASNIKKSLTPYVKAKIRCSDGKIYSLPRIYKNIIYYMGWLVRDDMMDQLNIEPPETLDDFYNMLKEMKKKYPDVYPLVSRQGIFSSFIGSWGVGDGLIFRNGKFELYCTNNESKECLMFIHKLYKEKLLDAEFPTCSTQQWEEKMMNNNGFVTFDYMLRSEYFENALKNKNPEFSLSVLPIPKAGNAKPNVWVPDKAYTNAQFVISAKTSVPKEVIRLFDYLYSPEGADMLNWGIKDVTYEERPEGRTFLPEVATALNPYGTIDVQRDYSVQCGLQTVVDSEAYAQLNLGKNSMAGVRLYADRDYARPAIPPVDSAIDRRERDKLNELQTRIYKSIDENILKFIIGKRSFSEWDNFQNELKELKVKEYLEIYQKAFDSLN